MICLLAAQEGGFVEGVVSVKGYFYDIYYINTPTVEYT